MYYNSYPANFNPANATENEREIYYYTLALQTFIQNLHSEMQNTKTMLYNDLSHNKELLYQQIGLNEYYRNNSEKYTHCFDSISKLNDTLKEILEPLNIDRYMVHEYYDGEFNIAGKTYKPGQIKDVIITVITAGTDYYDKKIYVNLKELTTMLKKPYFDKIFDVDKENKNG